MSPLLITCTRTWRGLIGCAHHSFRESVGHFRQWLDDLFAESWKACQDADVLIESPSTFAGIHIAEALKIPYFRAFT